MYFQDYFSRLHKAMGDSDEASFEHVAELLRKIRDQKGKTLVAGNGGSASIASHVAVDFTKAAGLPTMCFNEASLITCFANDFGYEHWLEKALEYYATPLDLVILISSSGKSPNMLRAAQKARDLHLPIVTLTGFGADNPLKSMGDVNFWVDSRCYNVIENVHQIWLLAISDRVARIDFNK
jgi:D-sedoheptulose 7-phosphate isomerase